MVIISGEVTIEDLDEAIGYLNERLKIDQYGNRMDWRKKEMLTEQLDELLEARFNLVHTGKP